MVKVAVVILNYNGKKYLEQFLPGVIVHSPNADVIVVDNNSSDDSVAFMHEHHPDLQLVLFKENYGYTGGYNKAISKLKHKYTVLLNSDIEVTPNWIEPIVEFMDSSEDISACQPKILAYHNKSKFEYAGAAGGFMDKLGYPYCRGRIFDHTEVDEGQYNEPIETFWSSGAALFIRTKDYKDAGGLDQTFFAHMEEIDLCWRLHRMGKKTYCVPDSTVYHIGGGTLTMSHPKKTYLNFRNNLSMMLKNEPFESLIWKLPTRFVLDFASALMFWKNESFAHFRAVIRAQLDFIILSPRTWGNKINFYYEESLDDIPYPTFSIVLQYFLLGKKDFKDIKKGKQ